MFWNYFTVFFISMVPIVEIRGAIPVATGLGLHPIPAYLTCILGNMVPVPFVYFLARKILVWGSEKPYIGRLFTRCLKKGEQGGQKLAKTAGRKGLATALILFVGIPLPGTGAWTGTLAASILDMGFKSTVAAVTAGVFISGIIMYLLSYGFVFLF